MRTAQPRSQGRDSGFHYKTPIIDGIHLPCGNIPPRWALDAPAVNDQSLTYVFSSRTSVQVKLFFWFCYIIWRDTFQRSHDRRNPKTNTKTYPTGLLTSANLFAPIRCCILPTLHGRLPPDWFSNTSSCLSRHFVLHIIYMQITVYVCRDFRVNNLLDSRRHSLHIWIKS